MTTKEMAELKKELARLNDAGASPIQRDQTGMLSASSPMNKIRAETEVGALASTCAITHTVHGKVAAANPRPLIIDWNSQRLSKYIVSCWAPQTVLWRFRSSGRRQRRCVLELFHCKEKWYGAKRWLGMGRGSS